jgi:hypothetical protein
MKENEMKTLNLHIILQSCAQEQGLQINSDVRELGCVKVSRLL